MPDDDKTEAPKKAEDKEKHSLAENEITLDDEDEVMELVTMQVIRVRSRKLSRMKRKRG